MKVHMLNGMIGFLKDDVMYYIGDIIDVQVDIGSSFEWEENYRIVGFTEKEIVAVSPHAVYPLRYGAQAYSSYKVRLSKRQKEMEGIDE